MSTAQDTPRSRDFATAGSRASFGQAGDSSLPPVGGGSRRSSGRADVSIAELTRRNTAPDNTSLSPADNTSRRGSDAAAGLAEASIASRRSSLRDPEVEADRRSSLQARSASFLRTEEEQRIRSPAGSTRMSLLEAAQSIPPDVLMDEHLHSSPPSETPHTQTSDAPIDVQALWPAEPPLRTQSPEAVKPAYDDLLVDSDMTTRDYLRGFYSGLLKETERDADDAHRRLVQQELQLRQRLYSLANADLYRVRFVEEARWELRERHEVLERREKLERSQLEGAFLELLREHLVSGGGSWSEDRHRLSIYKKEELGWRSLMEYHRKVLQQFEEREWESYLMAEDRWRWDVELTVRHGMHQIQLDEFRHRNYLETDLYPSELNKLMHVMELEWVELLKMQYTSYQHLLAHKMVSIVQDEEAQRQVLKKKHRRIMKEFNVLHNMLQLEQAEEVERRLLDATADRLFNILFSREMVQIKTLLDRTRIINESVAKVLAEKAKEKMLDKATRASHHGWGGEVYPELVRSSPGGQFKRMPSWGESSAGGDLEGDPKTAVDSLVASVRERMAYMKEAELDARTGDLARQTTNMLQREHSLGQRVNDVLRREAVVEMRESKLADTPRKEAPQSTGSATGYRANVPQADIDAALALLR